MNKSFAMDVFQPAIIGPVAAALIAFAGVILTIRANRKKKANEPGNPSAGNQQTAKFSRNTTQIQAGRDVRINEKPQNKD